MLTLKVQKRRLRMIPKRRFFRACPSGWRPGEEPGHAGVSRLGWEGGIGGSDPVGGSLGIFPWTAGPAARMKMGRWRKKKAFGLSSIKAKRVKTHSETSKSCWKIAIILRFLCFNVCLFLFLFWFYCILFFFLISLSFFSFSKGFAVVNKNAVLICPACINKG